MAKNLSRIRSTARQLLNDEFVSGSSQDFKNDELDIYIQETL
ncbi:unnamed protein product, partial [marine sediment metagenome]